MLTLFRCPDRKVCSTDFLSPDIYTKSDGALLQNLRWKYPRFQSRTSFSDFHQEAINK